MSNRLPEEALVGVPSGTLITIGVKRETNQ